MATNWDANKPAGSTKVRLADDEIRANNAALEDALGRDHNFPGNEGSDAGEHTKIKFYAPIATPGNEANKGFAYIKDVGGKVELHFLDEDGNEIQLTAAGILNQSHSVPSGEIILFEKDTAVAGYTLQTDKDDMVVYITKGSVAGGESGAADKTGGTWTQPNHTHTGPSHTHTGPSHTHTGPSHTHTGPSHNHKWYDAKHNTVDGDQSYNAAGSLQELAYFQKNPGHNAIICQDDINRALEGASEYDLYTSNDGTGNTGAGGTGATGAGGTGATGAGGTGATGGGATANTWRPSGRNFTRQQRN